MTEHSLSDRPLVRPGAAMKALRLERGWSLAEVSRRSGLPISSLSKIENDKMEVTLDRLLRISVALEVDAAGLFVAQASPPVVTETGGRRSLTRAGEGEIVDTHIGRYHYLAYELVNKGSIPIVIDVTARSLEEFGDFNRHPGEELLFVLEGELDFYTSLYIPVRLNAGDSMYFDSNMGHAYIAAGMGRCRILSVCIAPESQLLDMLENKAPRPGKILQLAG